jgi:hypothetical protein
MKMTLGWTAILLSLVCFALTLSWLRHLGHTSWRIIPANMANMPLDSSIGVAVTLAGVILFFAGVALLGSTRRPPS